MLQLQNMCREQYKTGTLQNLRNGRLLHDGDTLCLHQLPFVRSIDIQYVKCGYQNNAADTKRLLQYLLWMKHYLVLRLTMVSCAYVFEI